VTNFFESVAEPFSSAAETTGEVLGLVGLITGQPELEAVALGLEVAAKATKRSKNPATQPSNFGATSVRDPNFAGNTRIASQQGVPMEAWRREMIEDFAARNERFNRRGMEWELATRRKADEIRFKMLLGGRPGVDGEEAVIPNKRRPLSASEDKSQTQSNDEKTAEEWSKDVDTGNANDQAAQMAAADIEKGSSKASSSNAPPAPEKSARARMEAGEAPSSQHLMSA
jgi:hypothetical protein